MFGTFAILLFSALTLLLIGWKLVNNVQKSGAVDPDAPKKIRSFASIVEAEIVVAKLFEIGISAQAVGGYVSGFQAESPGYVDVLVANRDFEKATDFLQQEEAANGTAF